MSIENEIVYNAGELERAPFFSSKKVNQENG